MSPVKSPVYQRNPTKKNKVFHWTNECQSACHSLFNELTSELLLQLYSLGEEVTLTNNASEKTIDRFLTENGYPVFYVSHKLLKPEQRYSINEGEALAVVFAVTFTFAPNILTRED